MIARVCFSALDAERLSPSHVTSGSGRGKQSMTSFPVFLSVVFVVRNQARDLAQILRDATSTVSSLVTDYELIIVDNASVDDSITVLKELTSEGGLPNLQVFALTKEIDADTASWVGLENALGDFVAVIDSLADDIAFLPEMLERAAGGADVVFACNDQKQSQSIAYRAASSIFNGMYKRLSGIDLAKEAPQYRLLSKRVVNFILQYPRPSIAYRYLPATAGFTRANLSYSMAPRIPSRKRLGKSVDRSARLLVSTTSAPMRAVTSLSIFGAVANLCYSVYVVAIALFKHDVAQGWVSTSLQLSGMFFLISLVLFVLGEYLLNMVALANEGPLYHVAQEFTSVRITRRQKLNVEDVAIGPTEDAPNSNVGAPFVV